jgi:DNA-binding MarR family transcriptional regulator
VAIRDKPLFDLANSFTYQIHALGKLTDRVSQQAYLEATGLPISEGRCLAAIGAFRPLSVVDLAMRANLNKSQASRAAQTLVDRALVVKQANADDGRGVVLNLTAKGERVWRQVMGVIEQR